MTKKSTNLNNNIEHSPYYTFKPVSVNLRNIITTTGKPDKINYSDIIRWIQVQLQDFCNTYPNFADQLDSLFQRMITENSAFFSELSLYKGTSLTSAEAEKLFSDFKMPSPSYEPPSPVVPVETLSSVDLDSFLDDYYENTPSVPLNDVVTYLKNYFEAYKEYNPFSSYITVLDHAILEIKKNGRGRYYIRKEEVRKIYDIYLSPYSSKQTTNRKLEQSSER